MSFSLVKKWKFQVRVSLSVTAQHVAVLVAPPDQEGMVRKKIIQPKEQGCF